MYYMAGGPRRTTPRPRTPRPTRRPTTRRPTTRRPSTGGGGTTGSDCNVKFDAMFNGKHNFNQCYKYFLLRFQIDSYVYQLITSVRLFVLVHPKNLAFAP